MNVLATNNAPSASLVLSHFAFGSISLLILAVMMLLSSDAFLGAYFNHKLLAITHMTVLGWGNMIIYGALYQLIPVIYETKLYSERLAGINFVISGLGTIFLVYCFLTGNFGVQLMLASSVMLISIVLFVVNVLLTYRKSDISTIQSKFVTSAVIGLLITGGIGFVISLNFYMPFLTEIHLYYLKYHAIFGFVAWFLMLIIGVASMLLPMFFVAHGLNENWLRISFFALHFGLLLIILNWLFIDLEGITIGGSIILLLGLASFVRFIIQSYSKRLRKQLDIGMQFSMIAIVMIILPVMLLLGAYMLHTDAEDMLMKAIILFGVTWLHGFITSLILGQTFKTLPFIVWLSRYKEKVGKEQTPMPKDLYSKILLKVQLWAYVLFILFMCTGIVSDNASMVRTACIFFILVAMCYNVNVLKILRHKPKSNE